MMGAVFAMQGIGQFTGALVMLFVTLGFKSSLEGTAKISECRGDCQLAVDKMWRTLIGFGAVPACIALYCKSFYSILLCLSSQKLGWILTYLADRLTIPETPRYTFDVARDVEKANEDVKAYVHGKTEGHPDEIGRATTQKAARETLEVPKASWSDFFRHHRQYKNWSLLLGTAGSWFCLDVAFYGLSLNNGTILEVIGYSTKNADTVYKFLYNTAVGNIIIVLAGAVPGYWVSVATIDTLGRKKIQFGGFAILTVLFIIMGFAYNHISSNGLLAIYVLAQFFFNFGESHPSSTP